MAPEEFAGAPNGPHSEHTGIVYSRALAELQCDPKTIQTRGCR